MASNDVKLRVLEGNPKTGEVAMLIRFYQAEDATQAGTWVNVSSVRHAQLQIRGITTGTVQVWGINPDVNDDGEVEALPSDETGAIKIGSDITTDGIVEYDAKELLSYIKLKISAASDISLDAVMNVVKFGKSIS